MLPLYSLRYSFSSSLLCFSWVSPQVPQRKIEAVLGPSVGGGQNFPGVELRFAKKPTFYETVAGPYKPCRPLRFKPARLQPLCGPLPRWQLKVNVFQASSMVMSHPMPTSSLLMRLNMLSKSEGEWRKAKANPFGQGNEGRPECDGIVDKCKGKVMQRHEAGLQPRR